MIKRNSEGGRRLCARIEGELSQEYSYRNPALPEYVVVLIERVNVEEKVAEALEAFLGAVHSRRFAEW